MQICIGDTRYIIDNRESIYDRYIHNINCSYYEKYLTPQDRNNFETCFCDIDKCETIMNIINYDNIHFYINILKKCNHDHSKQAYLDNKIINKISNFFEIKNGFENALVVLETYLRHQKLSYRGTIVGMLYKHFRNDKIDEFTKLCDKYFCDDIQDEEEKESEKTPVKNKPFMVTVTSGGVYYQ